ncbi:MAG TPA: hypothetical protein PL183_07370 [Aquamicrobium sp.]|nr:hypothetical protein [Aquamicrobium sp.]
MSDALWMPLRFAVLALFIAGVAALSDWPRHRSIAEGMGVVTLSFSHGADRRAACRPATEEELAKMPPNMRRTQICPRGRPSIAVEFEIDGQPVFAAEVPPSGIAGDGPSRVNRSFELPAGSYELAVRMRDRPGDEFDWEGRRMVELKPADHRVVDFRADGGGFIFH